MADNPIVGDIGTVFTITITNDDVAWDVSSATSQSIILRSPSGVSTTNTSTFTTDGTDGKVTYTTTLASELSGPGTWSMQAEVVVTSGTFRTQPGTFVVGEAI